MAAQAHSRSGGAPAHASPDGTRGIGWVLAATLGWGTSSAVIAHLGGGPGAAAPVALGGAAALLGGALGLGRAPWRSLREGWRLYLLAGALEAFNLTTYVAALQLGSLPLVVSLHLSAPLWLMGAAIVRGHRRLSVGLVIEAALVGAACALVALSLSGEASPVRALLGAGLALASAVTVALLISVLARGSAGRDPLASGGFQLLVAGTLALPAMALSEPGGASTVALYALNGMLLMGPAFALYWRGLRTVAPTPAGIAGLSEAPIAAAVAAIVFGATFPPAMVLAGGCVLAAIAMARLQTT